MINYNADKTRFLLLSLSFDTDHVPETTFCWIVTPFPNFYFFLLGKVWGKKPLFKWNLAIIQNQNPQICPCYIHREGQDPCVAHLPHSCHQNRMFPYPPDFFCPPGNAFRSEVASAATLCLPADSFMCWCHFVPFSDWHWSGFIPEQSPVRQLHPSPSWGACWHHPAWFVVGVLWEGAGQLLHCGTPSPPHAVMHAALAGRLSAACWISSRSRESALLGSV